MRSEMSVFNSETSGLQSNPILGVHNLTWDTTASQKGVERVTDRIIKAIADEGKKSQRVVDAVKAGSEKVADAVGKIKCTQNTDQSHPTAAEAVHESLRSIAASTAQIADQALKNPNEIPAMLTSAKAIAEKYADLTTQATAYSQEYKRLHQTAAEVEKAAGWIGSNYGGDGCCQSVPVNNSFGRVVGNFQEL